MTSFDPLWLDWGALGSEIPTGGSMWESGTVTRDHIVMGAVRREQGHRTWRLNDLDI